MIMPPIVWYGRRSALRSGLPGRAPYHVRKSLIRHRGDDPPRPADGFAEPFHGQQRDATSRTEALITPARRYGCAYVEQYQLCIARTHELLRHKTAGPAPPRLHAEPDGVMHPPIRHAAPL